MTIITNQPLTSCARSELDKLRTQAEQFIRAIAAADNYGTATLLGTAELMGWAARIVAQADDTLHAGSEA